METLYTQGDGSEKLDVCLDELGKIEDKHLGPMKLSLSIRCKNGSFSGKVTDDHAKRIIELFKELPPS